MHDLKRPRIETSKYATNVEKPSLSASLLDSNLRESVRLAFAKSETKTFAEDDVEVSVFGSPFRIVSIHNVMANQPYTVHTSSKGVTVSTKLTDAETNQEICQAKENRNDMQGTFLSRVMGELEKVTHNQNHNDLYYFKQSRDLKVCTQPHVAQLRTWLYDEVRAFCETVTGMTLNPDRLNLFSARYPPTGRLLCHDDQLEGRKVAFIIYLSAADWSADSDEGGALEVYDSIVGPDGKLEPTPNPVKKLPPTWNTLSFFEVSEKSFHQVEEVIGNRTRYSVGGWFHELPRSRSSPSPLATQSTNGLTKTTIPEVAQQNQIPGETKVTTTVHPTKSIDVRLDDWINDVYLRPALQANVQDKFADDSSIQLKDFLLPRKFKELEKALMSKSTAWHTTVTPMKAKYGTLCEESPLGVISDVQNLFSSQPFLELVNALSGLVATSTATRIRKYAHGDYTMLPNGDTHKDRECLEVTLAICKKQWEESWGGVRTYLVDGEEVISIAPEGMMFVHFNSPV